jgi:hypothetical protein
MNCSVLVYFFLRHGDGYLCQKLKQPMDLLDMDRQNVDCSLVSCKKLGVPPTAQCSLLH